MTSSAASSSSRPSIPPTSSTLSTLSGAPRPSTKPLQITLLVPHEQRHFAAADWLPALPGVLSSVVGIYIVHRLTRGRDREKTALELYSSIGDQLRHVGRAAGEAWTTRAGPDRQRAVAETYWRLQGVGATVQRLRLLTSGHRWRLGWPPRVSVSVALTEEMAALRRAITGDPFDELNRRADRRGIVKVEIAIGRFQAAMDQRLHDWSL